MVQAIAFWTLYNVNKNQEASEIQNRLTTAKTIAKDYGLKEVFDDDTRSLLITLNNHRKRIDADLAMIISAKGIISGQL